MAKRNFALTEAQKKILFPAVASILLLVCFSYMVSYLMVTLNLLRTNISEANRKAKAIAELSKLSKKEKDILKAFPMAKEKNNIIREVAGWVREQGIEVAAIDPKEEALAGTNFTKLTLTLDAKGSYLQVMRFLKKLEAASYFLLPSSIKLNGFDLERRRFSLEQGELIDKRVQIDVCIFMVN